MKPSQILLNKFQKISKYEEWDVLVGEELPLNDFNQKRKHKSELQSASARIADELERNGYPAYTEDDLYKVSLLTGKAERILNLRNLLIFPIKAWQFSQHSMRCLEAYMDELDTNDLMSGCISMGIINVAEYRKHHLNLTGEKLPTIFRQLKRWGCEPLFYKIERTPKLIDGVSMVHLHVHFIFRDSPSKSKQDLEVYCRRHFNKKSDFRRISNDSSVTTARYFHKVEKLLVKGFDITTLAKQQEGLHFRQPLGGFREFVRRLNGENRRCVKDLFGNWAFPTRYERRPYPKRKIAQDTAVNQVLRLTNPTTVGNDRRLAPALVVRGYNGNFNELIAPDHVNKIVKSVHAIVKAKGNNKGSVTVTRTEDDWLEPINEFESYDQQNDIPF